jgi:hypothetical protein
MRLSISGAGEGPPPSGLSTRRKTARRSMTGGSASGLFLLLAIQLLQLVPQCLFRRPLHLLHPGVNLQFPACLMVPCLLLAVLQMVQPEKFDLSCAGNPVGLFGLELAFFQLFKVSVLAHALPVKVFGNRLAPFLLGGAARLGESGHPAPDAALLAFKHRCRPRLLFVQTLDFLKVAQLGVVAVPAPALKLVLVKGQYPPLLPPVFIDQVGMDAAMFGLNVGGCGGPAAIFGHDRSKSPKGFDLGFKMGRGKSKRQGFSGTGAASALPGPACAAALVMRSSASGLNENLAVPV